MVQNDLNIAQSKWSLRETITLATIAQISQKRPIANYHAILTTYTELALDPGLQIRSKSLAQITCKMKLFHDRRQINTRKEEVFILPRPKK